MHYVTPKVIRLAQTQLNTSHARFFLDQVGAPAFPLPASVSDGENLIELAGRLCYRSFVPGLNPNVTKIREGNRAYIQNILEQQHYSVFEHVHVTYAFLNVSRVFTHELVRHRLSNFSQESLRYVRLDELGAYYPDAFAEEILTQLAEELKKSDVEVDVEYLKSQSQQIFESFFHAAERSQTEFAQLFKFNYLRDFNLKKKLTSAMRRCAPIGLSTAIIMTTNLRNWMHIIQLRTSEHAEEEIQKVIKMVHRDLAEAYPNTFVGEDNG